MRFDGISPDFLVASSEQLERLADAQRAELAALGRLAAIARAFGLDGIREQSELEANELGFKLENTNAALLASKRRPA